MKILKITCSNLKNTLWQRKPKRRKLYLDRLVNITFHINHCCCITSLLLKKMCKVKQQKEQQ
jgi:hypothetical protein